MSLTFLVAPPKNGGTTIFPLNASHGLFSVFKCFRIKVVKLYQKTKIKQIKFVQNFFFILFSLDVGASGL